MTKEEKEFNRGWEGSRIVQACKIESRIKAEEKLVHYEKRKDDYHRGIRRGLELALKIVKSDK